MSPPADVLDGSVTQVFEDDNHLAVLVAAVIAAAAFRAVETAAAIWSVVALVRNCDTEAANLR